MADRVNRRPYHSPTRTAQAARTRHEILVCARRLFLAQGYAATTMAQVAAAAGVAQDTVYAALGPKPAVFRLLLEAAISGTDEAVPAEQRGYVRRIRAAATAQDKIEVYAAALADVLPRLAPLDAALDEGAAHVPELAALREEIDQRRAANMRRFADDLLQTGQVRPDLDPQEVADVVWSTSAAAFYRLLVLRRGWSPQRYGRWLADTWERLFLAAVRLPPGEAAPPGAGRGR